MRTVLVVFLTVFLIKVYSIPTNSGADLQQENVQKIATNAYDSVLKQGASIVENENKVIADSKKDIDHAKDTQRYLDKVLNERRDSEHSTKDEQGYQQQEVGTLNDYGAKAFHKKGHHKSGFHKSYYKDEGGSNSSYFDDAADEKGEELKRTNNANYGDLSQHKYAGDFAGQNYNLVDHNKDVYKNKEKQIEEGRAENKNRIANKYYDAHEDGLNKNHLNENVVRSHSNENVIRSPHLSQPEVTRTITVYEDPRIAYRDTNRYYNYPEYGGKGPNLVVRAPRDFYDYSDYPIYSDYY